jgi:hypothetical protein
MGDAARAALSAALSGVADEDVVSYARDVASGVLDDAAPGASAASVAEELSEALGPILEDAGLSGDAVSALCASLAAAHVGAGPGGGGAAAAADAADRLVDLKSIILAFAGKVRASAHAHARTTRKDCAAAPHPTSGRAIAALLQPAQRAC